MDEHAEPHNARRSLYKKVPHSEQTFGRKPGIREENQPNPEPELVYPLGVKGVTVLNRNLAGWWCIPAAILALAFAGSCTAQKTPEQLEAFSPGARVILDAHNCYPYDGKYADRIDRALATGLPVSIEIDLAWRQEPGNSRSVISHSTATKGDEPSLETYFFERVRPLVEKALAEGDQKQWPILYLHFDFKSNEREHLAYVAGILARYRDWLSSSVRVEDEAKMQPIERKPILVITETDEMQKRVFHDEAPLGQRFYVFGSAPGETYISKDAPREEQLARMVTATPMEMLNKPAGNYRRWWNNSWAVVEEGGAPRAGEWTRSDRARLEALVANAHRLGYLVRFYTLNGHAADQGEGWGSSYNFGSMEAVRSRWQAAYQVGVDFIASDQYEELGIALHQYSKGK